MTVRMLQGGDLVAPAVDDALADIEWTRGSLTRRGRRRARAIALLAVLAMAGALWAVGALPGAHGREGAAPEGAAATSAAGTPVRDPAAATAPTGQGPVLAEWDGPALQLDWAGRGYADAAAAFVGDRVFAPGDVVTRTLQVTNPGPADATLIVSLSTAQTTPTDARNLDLAARVVIDWSVGGISGGAPFADVLDPPANSTTLAQVRVARGQTVPVAVTARMPADVVDQGRAGATSVLLDFDVQVVLRGEVAPPLAVTGAAPWPLVWPALGILSIGLLLILRRASRCTDCERPLAEGQRRALACTGGGERLVLCEPCAHDRGVTAR